jgi:hypothetical protein
VVVFTGGIVAHECPTKRVKQLTNGRALLGRRGADLADLVRGGPGRDVQRDQRGAAVGQVAADASESRFGCGIVREQVERRPGQEDRLEPARQVQRLHPLVVEADADTVLVCPTSAARQHVR